MAQEPRYVSTGSTLLNLALTGRHAEGLRTGRISNIVGDKSTGKTLLAIETINHWLASASKDKVEVGAHYVESEAAFDQDYAAQLGMDVEAVQFDRTRTVEDLCNHLESLCKIEHPALVVVDSLDALSDDAELDKKIEDSTYGTRKARQLSVMFRRLVKPIEESQLHLFIISQVRENISALPYSPKYVRSGGKALDFYSSHIVWLAEISKIKDNKTKLATGVNIKAKVTKNKSAPPFRDVEFPIVFGYGIDDIRSLIAFLSTADVPDGMRISKSGAWYRIGDEKLQLKDYVAQVERDPKAYADLRTRAEAYWAWREENVAPERPSKADLMRGSLT